MAKFALGVQFRDDNDMASKELDVAFVEIDKASAKQLLQFRDKYVVPMQNDADMLMLYGIEVSLSEGPLPEFRCSGDIPDELHDLLCDNSDSPEGLEAIRLDADFEIPAHDLTTNYRGTCFLFDSDGVRWTCYEKHVYLTYVTKHIVWEDIEKIANSPE